MEILDIVSGGAFGNLVGLLGILLAIFFFVRGNKKKKLVFINKEQVVIDGDVDVVKEKLSVLFDGVQVPRVT